MYFSASEVTTVWRYRNSIIIIIIIITERVWAMDRSLPSQFQQLPDPQLALGHCALERNLCSDVPIYRPVIVKATKAIITEHTTTK